MRENWVQKFVSEENERFSMYDMNNVGIVFGAVVFGIRGEFVYRVNIVYRSIFISIYF